MLLDASQDRYSYKQAYTDTILTESKASRLRDMVKGELLELIVMRHDKFKDLDLARSAVKKIAAIKPDDKSAKETIVKILTGLHEEGVVPKSKAAKEISKILKKLS